ncbi:MAG: response regulator [Chromatiales bacterium]|jgi:signal transduction histidine kinase/CheY-like chemotaxis protein
MSIRSRLTLALLAFMGLFTLNLAVFTWSQSKQDASVDRLSEAVSKQLDVVSLAQRVREQNRRGFLLRTLLISDQQTRLKPEELEAAVTQISELDRNVERLARRADTNDREEIERVQWAFGKLMGEWYDFYGRFAAASAGRDETTAEKADWEHEYEQLLSRLQLLHEAEKSAVSRASATLDEIQALTDRTSFIIFACSALISVVLGFTVVHAISRGVETLRDGATRLGEGDLEHRIHIRARNELGELAEAFNRMSARLGQAMEQAQAASAAADEANHAKSRFLANMSHELRTPLNAIIGYSEMLLEEAGELGPDELSADLQKILSAGRHLLSLINHVLDLSKIEAGKMQVYVESFEVPAMLGELESTIAPLVAKNDNRLRLEVGPDVGLMATDQTKLRQTLLNLLSNACKFTERGEIGLEARLEAADGEDWMIFTVTDTGVGMTEEGLSRIFNAFSQAELSTTKQYGGTGLGLAISRQFCQLLGGDIGVQSEPGKGTRFTVRLPRDIQKAKTPPAGAPPPEVNPERLVLVIDDDPAALELARRSLVKHGFSVVTASSGEEGIALARQIHPVVITLDILMPGMDGWQVLSALKADPETAAIPVVMMSMVDDRELGFALGAADYMMKPIDRNRLTQVLECLLRDQRGAQVLIAEGDQESSDALAKTLEQHGFQVSRARNGREALAKLHDARPDLIFVDVALPEMDAVELLEAVSRKDAWKDIPVVVLSDRELSPADRERLSGGVRKVLTTSGSSPEHILTQICEFVARGGHQGSESK